MEGSIGMGMLYLYMYLSVNLIDVLLNQVHIYHSSMILFFIRSQHEYVCT